MVGLYGGACPISTVLFPFKMMTIEGSYVGTLEDLKELFALVQAGKVPPIPIEAHTRAEISATENNKPDSTRRVIARAKRAGWEKKAANPPQPRMARPR
jgi:D-arabinose 1-dehydrogenase-like Zn-dependent alcohol dehydrogenase